jgi:YidC/Oxa1 family membrane protein insertase
MDKKTILAILLCILVWIAWQAIFYQEPPPPPPAPDAGVVTQQDGGVAATPAPDVPRPEEFKAAERAEERLVTLRNKLMELVLTSRSASVKSLKLLAFKERVEGKKLAESGPEDLVSTHDETALPLRIRFREENSSFRMRALSDWSVVEQSDTRVAFRFVDPADPSVPALRKVFQIKPDSHEIELEVEVENRTESSIQEQIILDVFAGVAAPPSAGCASCMGGMPMTPRLPACMKGDGVFPVPGTCSPASMKPGEAMTLEPDIRWAGINEQYFLMAAVPVGVEQSVCRLEARVDQVLVASLMYPKVDLPPGARTQHRFRVFAGPKHLETMAMILGGPGEGNQPARLEASVDYGWLAVLCHPLLWMLRQFYSFVQNWGVAILILTLLIKLVLLPLNQKQMKVMKKTARDMARIKPQLDALRARFKEDRQKLNEETMKLYKSNNINPFGALSGCFPLLLQMPIWIALYRMLYSSVELYQAPFISGWIEDLSYRDPWFLLPIVMGVSMFLQQKLAPPSPTADPQQAKMMMYMMPGFFTFIMLYLPAGLALYIFVNTILSIAHQLIYNRMTAEKPAEELLAKA